MTAALMGMPTSSRYGVAFGDSNSAVTKRNPDLIERFFSGFEGVFCAPRSVEALSKEIAEEPILLDYVFDHVESFTCATDDLSYQNDPFLLTPTRGHHHGGFPEDGSKADSYDFALKRENSLVEQGPNGAPAYMATTRQPARIAACGTEGDLLDYCFEHVESFVCNNNEDEPYSSNNKSGKSSRTPMRNTTNNQRRQQASPEPSHPIPRVISTPRKRKKKRRNRQKQNYYPDEEDNILLYFRPIKSADV